MDEECQSEFDALAALAAEVQLERLVAIASTPLVAEHESVTASAGHRLPATQDNATADRFPFFRESWSGPRPVRQTWRPILTFHPQERRAFAAGREVPWAVVEAVEEIRWRAARP